MNTSIIRFIATALAVIAAIVAGLSVGDNDLTFPIILSIALLAILFTPALYQLGCLLIFMVSPLIERGLSLPFGLGPYHLVVIILTLMLIVQVAFQRHSFAIGNPWIIGFNAIIAGILVYHISTQGLGSSAFGSVEMVGGRRYFNFFFAIVGFILINNLPLPPYFSKYLWLFALPAPILVATLDLVLYFQPSLLPFMSLIYTGTSFENVNAFMVGSDVYRIAGFRELAATGVMLLLAYWKTTAFFSRKIFIVVPIVAICGTLFLLSGFRAFILLAVITGFVISIVDLKFRSLVFPFCLVIILLFLSFGNGYLFELPSAAQRILSFLPGNWDYRVQQEGIDTVLWRFDLWSYFFQKYFPGQEWIGNGMLYENTQSDNMMLMSMGIPVDSLIMIAQDRSWHNGALAVIDSAGMIGFICWILTMLWIFRYIFQGLKRIYRGDDTVPIRFFTSLTLYYWLFDIYADGITQTYAPLMVSTALLNRFLQGAKPLPQAKAIEAPTESTYSYS